MRWFFPSFSGDFRLEDEWGKALLTVERPTPAEKSVLVDFLKEAHRQEWTVVGELPETESFELVLHCSVAEAAPIFAKAVNYKPKGKLTVFRSVAGKYTAQEEVDIPAPKDADVAVAVRRPTLCCPNPKAGPADRRAEHVVEAMLPPLELSRWKQHRTVHVRGGMSGHLFRVAARDTRIAERQGRICYDLTDNHVIHFHDSLRPAAEEVLAAYFILRFREDWVCNEATGGLFKNPFGGSLDGTGDAALCNLLGGFALGFGAQRGVVQGLDEVES